MKKIILILLILLISIAKAQFTNYYELEIAPNGTGTYQDVTVIPEGASFSYKAQSFQLPINASITGIKFYPTYIFVNGTFNISLKNNISTSGDEKLTNIEVNTSDFIIGEFNTFNFSTPFIINESTTYYIVFREGISSYFILRGDYGNRYSDGTLWGYSSEDSFWNSRNPVDLIMNITYASGCQPNWVCDGYAACEYNDNQSCNSVTDTESCGVSYTGDYSEFANQTCNYCDSDQQQIGYGQCTDNAQYQQYRDLNWSTCCQLTYNFTNGIDCIEDDNATYQGIYTNSSDSQFCGNFTFYESFGEDAFNLAATSFHAQEPSTYSKYLSLPLINFNHTWHYYANSPNISFHNQSGTHTDMGIYIIEHQYIPDYLGTWGIAYVHNINFNLSNNTEISFYCGDMNHINTGPGDNKWGSQAYISIQGENGIGGIAILPGSIPPATSYCNNIYTIFNNTLGWDWQNQNVYCIDLAHQWPDDYGYVCKDDYGWNTTKRVNFTLAGIPNEFLTNLRYIAITGYSHGGGFGEQFSYAGWYDDLSIESINSEMSYCGDNICQSGETVFSCLEDCFSLGGNSPNLARPGIPDTQVENPEEDNEIPTFFLFERFNIGDIIREIFALFRERLQVTFEQPIRFGIIIAVLAALVILSQQNKGKKKKR